MKRLLIRYEYHYHQISSLSKKHHHHKQPPSIAIILKWKPWAGTWWPDLRRAWHCRQAGWSSCSGSSRTCTPEVWMVGEVLWTWTEVLSHLYKKKYSVNLWHVRSIAAHGVVAVVGRELEAAVESNVLKEHFGKGQGCFSRFWNLDLLYPQEPPLVLSSSHERQVTRPGCPDWKSVT